MVGEQGRILYVGKAKSLRDRLASYGRARPEDVPRKVIRMLNAVREIRIERCATETEALLRENFLLREIKPPFNRANTRPESYYLIALQSKRGDSGHTIALRLTTELEQREDETLFGAFKGRGATRRGFSALLRLLWVAHAELPERFEFPLALCKEEAVMDYELNLRDEALTGPLGAPASWPTLLERFLQGTSRALLPALSERILQLTTIPPFFARWIEEDLLALDAFFQIGPKRNRRLKKHSGVSGRLIAQDEIDDLLVSYSQRKKEKKRPRGESK